MAMTDAPKRKEPEPESPPPAKAAAEGKAAETPAKEPQAKPADAAAGRPDAKRLKPAPVEPAVVRKQVEYYLSDDNLKHDKFFHEKIASDSEGWLDMGLVLSCNKMKAMRATKEDVLAALAGSKLELKDGGAAVRRPGNAPLPALEAKPQHHQKKKAATAHVGGAVVVFKGVPSEQSWMQVKEKLREKLPQKVVPWHVSEVSDKGECFVLCPPFDGDLKLFEGLELELGGATVKCEPCFGDLLQQTLKTLPRHIREKREKEARKQQKDRNRPIVVGSQRFVNMGALRGKVKEILNSRSDGEALKPEGTDFKLIRALLDYHPKGAAKTAGTVGLKVNKSTQGDNRCFFMIRGDGAEEDVSMKKCLDAVEADPPFVQLEPKPKGAEKARGAEKAAGSEKAAGAEKAAGGEKAAGAEHAEAKAAEGDAAAPAPREGADAPAQPASEAPATADAPAAAAPAEAPAAPAKPASEAPARADAAAAAAPAATPAVTAEAAEPAAVPAKAAEAGEQAAKAAEATGAAAGV